MVIERTEYGYYLIDEYMSVKFRRFGFRAWLFSEWQTIGKGNSINFCQLIIRKHKHALKYELDYKPVLYYSFGLKSIL